MKSVLSKLLCVQAELKAPKNQFNSFGKYKYRSFEDILEAVKPLLKNQGLVLTISDEMKLVGERYYIQSTSTLTCIETGECIVNTAMAREPETKKGADDSQITGATSSYCRKYLLNGLLLIDDNKDADHTNDHGKQEQAKPAAKTASNQAAKPAGIDLDDAVDLLNQQTDVQALQATFAKLWKAATDGQKEPLKATYDRIKAALEEPTTA